MKILETIKGATAKVVAFLKSLIISVTKDKLLHFLAGLLIAYFVGLLNPLWGLGAAIVAGCTKELYDAFTSTNKAEWLDLVASAVGGAVGMMMAIF